jgi:ATP-dependent Clp protease ATP-binding subunit ClpA
MFERFTDRARRTVVHAQDEARRLNHNYIGTEHVLLGLLDEPGGIAALALTRFDLTRDVVRDDVLGIIGMGKQEPSGKIPFTPRAKKVLELSLREALQLGHNYIGTEHILLGLIREGEGVAAQIMTSHTGDLGLVRAAVLDVLPVATARAPQGRRWLRRRQAGAEPLRTGPEEPGELRTTPAADASLEEAARLAAGNPVGSHHMLLAALADPETAAARALVSLGVDLDRVRAVLRSADVTGSSDELPEEAGRRQMLIRVSDDRVTIEAADQAIVKLGHAALDAVNASGGGGTGGTGKSEGSGHADVIRGDDPTSVSLAAVWQSLHDALVDVRRRATVVANAPTAARDAPAGAENEPASDDPETGAEASGDA